MLVISYIALTIFLGLCVYIFSTFKDDYSRKQYSQQLAKQYQLASFKQDTTSEDYDWSCGMLEKNEDYKGWLTVYGTSINAPVVQGEDNEEYLHTNFEGEYDIGGVLYQDYACDNTAGGNILIYGHMMPDETMFGPLRNFTDSEFFKKNRTIRYVTENSDAYYEAFAVLVLPGYATSKDYVDYRQYINHISKGDALGMLNITEEKSFLFQKDDSRKQRNGQYLYLMTCTNLKGTKRLVIVAEKIMETVPRKEETENEHSLPTLMIVDDTKKTTTVWNGKFGDAIEAGGVDPFEDKAKDTESGEPALMQNTE